MRLVRVPLVLIACLLLAPLAAGGEEPMIEIGHHHVNVDPPVVGHTGFAYRGKANTRRKHYSSECSTRCFRMAAAMVSPSMPSRYIDRSRPSGPTR